MNAHKCSYLALMLFLCIALSFARSLKGKDIPNDPADDVNKGLEQNVASGYGYGYGSGSNGGTGSGIGIGYGWSGPGQPCQDGQPQPCNQPKPQPQPQPCPSGSCEPQPQPCPIGGPCRPQPQPKSQPKPQPQPQPCPINGPCQPQPQPCPITGPCEPQPQPQPCPIGGPCQGIGPVIEFPGFQIPGIQVPGFEVPIYYVPDVPTIGPIPTLPEPCSPQCSNPPQCCQGYAKKENVNATVTESKYDVIPEIGTIVDASEPNPKVDNEPMPPSLVGTHD